MMPNEYVPEAAVFKKRNAHYLQYKSIEEATTFYIYKDFTINATGKTTFHVKDSKAGAQLSKHG